jgi:uncharacterized membrane protein
MSGVPQIATVATALGCGLVAGTFFGFSTFIMPSLDRLVPGQSISAMQSINKVVLSPWFMTALFGTAVVTMAANVPLNDTLDTLRPDGPAAAADWADFYGPWTLWNTVRTIAGIGAAGLLTIGLTVE